MSRYDDLKGSMQALYDAAIAELAELDKKRQEVLNDIEYLGNICGKKTYTVKQLQEPSHVPAKKVGRGMKKNVCVKAPVEKKSSEGKKPRIKTEVVMGLVMKYLQEAAPDSLSANEILCKLDEEGLAKTDSFQTRIYSKLSEWVKEGLIIKPSRGVYQIAPKNND